MKKLREILDLIEDGSTEELWYEEFAKRKNQIKAYFGLDPYDYNDPFVFVATAVFNVGAMGFLCPISEMTEKIEEFLSDLPENEEKDN